MYEQLKELVSDIETDWKKMPGNESAGRRVRKGLSAIKNQAHLMRSEVQKHKKSQPK